jgi:hypothetical protein
VRKDEEGLRKARQIKGRSEKGLGRERRGRLRKG